MFDYPSLAQADFFGFVSWSEMDLAAITPAAGVYMVLRDGHRSAFAPVGTGGWFKGKDPNVAVEVLERKWIEPADVVYIGKATSLRQRLRQYRDFGSGKPVGHWGGRYIWQLERAHELRVCWQVGDDPAGAESRSLSAFVDAFGALPFANLRF